MISVNRRFASKLRASAALGVVAALALVSCSTPAPKDQAAKAPASKVAAIKEPADDARPRHLRLVTGDQYLNTLAYVFGPDVKPDVRFPPMERTDGLLQVGTSHAGVTDTQLEMYQ